MKSSNFKAQLLQSKQLQNAIGKMVKIGAWEYELNSGDGIWTNELYSIMELPFSAPTPRMDEYITYFPESALPIVRKNWLNLVEKQIPFDIEIQVFTHKKNTIWARAIGEPLVSEPDNHIVRGTFQDITQQKMLEIKSKENESDLQKAMDIALIGRWSYDLKEDLFSWSKNAANIFHFTESNVKLTLEDFYQILHKDDKDRIAQEVEKSWRTGLFESEYRFLVNNNIQKWAHVKYHVEYDSSKSPIKAVGIVQDITKSKSMELELRRRDEQLDHIIKNVPGAVFRCKYNKNFDMEFLSSQIKDITGYQFEDFVPQGKIPFSAIIKKSDLKEMNKALANAAKEEKPYEIQYRIFTKEKKEKWVSEKGVITESGKFIEGIITDIDDRVRHEEKILSASLLAEDNERHRISKDLNDGVQQVLASSLFNFQALEDEVKRCSIAVKNLYSQGLDQLMKGLDESRIIAYSIMPMTMKDFGLISTLESMIENINQTSTIEFSLEDDLGGKRLNEILEISIYRICQEAVKNALKYSNASKVEIKLREFKEVYILSIEDDGMGFNMDEKPIYESEGLGFSYMKSRANSINASIDISSMEGIGTIVSVEIPKEWAS